MAMEQDVCNVVYLDRRAAKPRVCARETYPHESTSDTLDRTSLHTPQLSLSTSLEEVDLNIQSILTVFNRVSVHRSSSQCLLELKAAYEKNAETKCTLVLIDIPAEEDANHEPPAKVPQSPSPTTEEPPEFKFQAEGEDYGMAFLVQVSSEIRAQIISPLIVPIALLSGAHEPKTRRLESPNPFQSPNRMRAERFAALDSISKMRYFDAGAADVLTSPTSADRIRSLPAHAHWMKLETEKTRSNHLNPTFHRKKTSWVGIKDDKPYTRLKEAMVSELMDHICNPELQDAPLDPVPFLRVDPNRHDLIAAHFSGWSFSAHMFTDDELLYGAFLMLDHALQLDELDKWRMGKDELLGFLFATRRVYNSSVLYHNFRHACDVLQAVFVFLVRIGALPPLFGGEPVKPSPMASLIDPFHALLLLISAIGHDVGHPGVNNGFLVTVNAPLAQLYNDRSVLESFHCAAYSQILRRYWKSTFNDRTMRRLMINIILATDMGVHRDYMSQMETLQETFDNDRNVAEWSDKKKEETRELLCCLLIKCADICNVARDFEVASEWARILIDEFHAQGQIEHDLSVPSALFGGPPDPTNLLQKCHSQIGFMSVFAHPLFGGIARLLPGMQYAVDSINYNKSVWQDRIKFENERMKQEQLKLEDEKTQTVADSKSANDTIQTPSRASLLEPAGPPPERRASAGITADFVDVSASDAAGKRPSLGHTALPNHVKKKSSSAPARQRKPLLSYIFCCSSPQPPLDEPQPPTAKAGNESGNLKRVVSSATCDEETNYGDSKEASKSTIP